MEPITCFSPSFHIETSPWFCSAKQMSGIYIKRNTGLKFAKQNIDSLKIGLLLPNNEVTVKLSQNHVLCIISIIQ